MSDVPRTAGASAPATGDGLPSPIQITNAEFLGRVFGDHPSDSDEYLWVAHFATPPTQANPGQWGGYPVALPVPAAVAERDAQNTYFCVSVLRRDAQGEQHRRRDTFAGLRCVVLDDATPIPGVVPTWILQTSAPDGRSNCQVGYRLTAPVTDVGIATRLHQALADAGELTADRNGNNPVRYVRLPIGANTKYDPPHGHRLLHWAPEVSVTLEALAAGLGLDLPAILTPPTTVAAPTPAPTGERADWHRKARKIAWDAARRTHDDPALGRHAEIFRLGAYAARDGLPPESLELILGEFAERMRPTNTSGELAPIDLEDEIKAIRDGYAKSHADGIRRPSSLAGAPVREAEAARVTVSDGQKAFLLDEKSSTSGAVLSSFPRANAEQNHRHDRHHRHAQDAVSLADAVAVVESAIQRCPDEPGALASPEFTAALQVVRAQSPEDWFRLRVAIRKARPHGVRLDDIDRASRPPSEPVDDTSTADELVALVLDQAELFHAEDGACFAALRSTPRKCFHLDTKLFAEWLGYAFYRATETERGPGRAASDTAIRTARVILAGIAKNDGPERKVYLRCAELDGRYYIDMGDDEWSAIEVTVDGWRLVERPPVYFWRASTLRPLPLPVPGGDLELLWTYCNVPKSERELVTAWALESFRPETPFPILELVGPQGAAKSSTQARLRRVLDPNAVDLRALPKSVEDLFVSAGCTWIQSLNNLSHLTANMQDALCNLATGGGFAGRTLFTNADETLIEAKRPVVANGIVPVVTQQDLTDRVIHIELPEIATYRSETEIEAAFLMDAPKILGGLLDLLVITLRELPTVTLRKPPRMADFAMLGEAMMRAQRYPEGTFLALYEANRRESTARGLEASPVAVAIRAMVAAHEHPRLPAFEGNWELLLAKLDSYRESHGAGAWPKSSRGLSDVVRRQRPALAQIGIRIDISGRTNQGIKVTIMAPPIGDGGDGRDGGFTGSLPAEKESGRSAAVEVEL